MIELVNEFKIEVIVMIFSMIPLIELRGGIPLGISLGLEPIQSMIISTIGNIFIVFILLNILNPIMASFEKTKLFNATLGKIKAKSMKKSRVIKKYSILGLFIFVSLPLPTTGAWTGALISSILKLDIKKAFMAMSLGLIIAGFITLTISYGLFTIF